MKSFSVQTPASQCYSCEIKSTLLCFLETSLILPVLMKCICLPAAALWCILDLKKSQIHSCFMLLWSLEASLSSADKQLKKGMWHFQCLSALLVGCCTSDALTSDSLMLIYYMTDKGLMWKYTSKMSIYDLPMSVFGNHTSVVFLFLFF